MVAPMIRFLQIIINKRFEDARLQGCNNGINVREEEIKPQEKNK